MLRLVVFLLIAYLTSVILATSQGGPPTVVIDGYNANKSIDSPANLPLGTTLVLICRVSGIPLELQSHTNYSWKCPNKACSQEGYVGRKITNKYILAINITSMSDNGTYTCIVTPKGRGEIRGQFRLEVTGGKVVHSYGRLIIHEKVISDRQQLQPPNNASGNGRIECRVSSGEAKFAYFGYTVSTDSSKDVYKTGDDGGLNAVVIKQEAKNFAIEGRCAGLFHYLFLKNDTICNELTFDIPTFNSSSITVNISTLPVGIARAIVGYTRLDLGVPVEGEYENFRECETRTFSTLVPGTKYRITAWGLSGGDTDDRRRCQSPTVREVSTSPQHASPPRNVTITRIFKYGIQLNWIPPKEPNGDIMCYSIKYTMQDGPKQGVDTTGNINYYNLTGLEREQNYTIRVAAYNSKTGIGEESDMMSYRHKEVRGKILSIWTNITSNDGGPTLKVSWTSNCIEAIMKYIVKFERNGIIFNETELSKENTSMVLDDLEITNNDRVYVAPVTDFGEGDGFWEIIELSVPRKIPSWKVIPTLSEGTAGLRIEWEEPDSDSKIITYEVKVDLGDNVTVTNISHTNYTIKGLKTSTKYRVTVTAISVVGRSAESAVQGTYPSTQIPNIVTFNSNLTKVSETEMDLYINVFRYGELRSKITLTVKDDPVTASRSKDYNLKTTHLSIDQTSQMMEKATIVVQIIDDNEEEKKEEFKLTLSTESGDNVLYIVKEMTICIEDDDTQISR